MTPITVTYYSDVLCIWAYVAQARVDAIRRTFPEEVRLDYRFVSVFGDTRLKLGEGWRDRDGCSVVRLRPEHASYRRILCCSGSEFHCVWCLLDGGR